MGFCDGYRLAPCSYFMPRLTVISYFSICSYSDRISPGVMSSLSPMARYSLNLQNSVVYRLFGLRRWQPIRYRSNALVTLNTDDDVARFSIEKPNAKPGTQKKGSQKPKKKMSRKAKLNELKWYWLKAKKKMKSPNPEVRMRYKLEKEHTCFGGIIEAHIGLRNGSSPWPTVLWLQRGPGAPVWASATSWKSGHWTTT